MSMHGMGLLGLSPVLKARSEAAFELGVQHKQSLLQRQGQLVTRC